MRSHSYLNTAKKIIQSYDGTVPLAAWLKQFFRTDKKFGSKDRKEISQACYCFYRLGRALQSIDMEEKILTGLFLCSFSSNKILEELKPEWNGQLDLPLSEKLKHLSAQEEVKNIFPFSDEVSDEIDLSTFNQSFLVQPDLFLRIRPGKNEKVLRQLQAAGAEFGLDDDCIRLSNQAKVDEIVNIDEDAVVQDYNSQKTLEPFRTSIADSRLPIAVWDCCAASGGKSILFHDHFPNAHLTVSDVRESILINLQKRFSRAGIKNYNRFVADLSAPDFEISRKFDLVLCDAPCSGSGTWSRTPEQLHFFKQERIAYYAQLQKKIVSNAVRALKKNGQLLYITCSVFKKENEEVAAFIQQNLSLGLQSMRYLKGYAIKADSLFAALFTRI